MNATTVYNHSTRLKNRIGSIYSTARISGMSHADLIKKIHDEVLKDDAYRKLPKYVQSAIGEMSAVLFKDIQLNWVVWMHLNSKGKQVFWEDLSDVERENYIKEDKSGKHYWLRLKTRHGRSKYDLKSMTATREYEITNRVW